MTEPGLDELTKRVREVSPLASAADPARLRAVVALVRDRMTRPSDFEEVAGFFFADAVEVPHDDLIPAEKTDTNTAAVLRLARQIVVGIGALERDPLERRLRVLAEESGWTMRELLQTLRWALSGKREAPPVVACMCLLGQATCIERIDAAIDVLGSPENPILGPSGR